MARQITNNLGTVSIGDEVLATLAGVAATECYGIVGMASRRVKDGIAELLGRENLSKGVEVAFDQERVSIKLHIVVGYGTRISEVARNVCDQVKYVVEQATGLVVDRIDIFVQGVKVGETK
ncbi:MAG: Asp23/Gls24 family envelope stress response protein [Bacillota bacterium]